MISALYLPRFNMCSSCLLLFTALFVVISAQKDSSSNFDSKSECYNYQISFGGKYLRKFYTCCEKPATTGTVSPCKEPDPIANFQCYKESSFEEKNVTKEFNCKGQTGQKNAMQRCTTRWAWLEQDEDDPECWAWSKCFAGACEKEEENTGSSLNVDFCGDGRCDSFTEDGNSCPIDCCPQVNPEECQVVNNTCPDPCCGQPLCCILPRTATSFSTISDVFIYVIVGVAAFIVLLNLCCCFCCVCCAKRCCKKYKKDKHDKHGKSKEKNTPV
ncbi:uncharacterized protein [Amphiura filiformis]|uniref:uncharacterized protein n=1 Tax=Amphiura filiformis TaxID=82378 RepID=UPI003B218776